MPQKSLKGLRVWVPRPNNALCQPIIQAGGEAYFMPLLAIEALPPQLTHKVSLTQHIATLSSSDWVIFVSVHAVAHAMAYWPKSSLAGSALPQIAAIGPSTCSKLKQYGIAVSAQPDTPFNSERLLALPVFQHVQGKKILIIKGQGGRRLLADTFCGRHASVTVVSVYRRYFPRISPEQWLHLCRYKPQVVVITSVDLLRGLIQLKNNYNDSGDALADMVWLVASERIAAFGRQMMAEFLQGNQLIVARDVAQDALIDALIDLTKGM